MYSGLADLGYMAVHLGAIHLRQFISGSSSRESSSPAVHIRQFISGSSSPAVHLRQFISGQLIYDSSSFPILPR
jgi:hypothetical protein